jgi:hypothetical protein
LRQPRAVTAHSTRIPCPQDHPSWPPRYIVNWDNAGPWAGALLAQATADATYKSDTEAFLKMWTDGTEDLGGGQRVLFTPYLLAYATQYEACTE